MLDKITIPQRRRVYALVTLVMAVFFVSGVIKLMTTHAATAGIAVQPENGTVTSPAAKISDTSASGGSAVKFASAATPPPPPVTPPPPAPGGSFSFSAFSDTKTGTSILAEISKQVYPISGKFILYPGDTCVSGPTAACFAVWKGALNAGGDIFDKAFVSRGNHDSDANFWAANFNFSAVAARVGATHYTGGSMTYSFDYSNSHFIAVDLPGGDATSMSSSQLSWVDSDLTSAEARGMHNSFLFFHGPEVPEGGHCCTNAPNVINLLGKHKSVAATFNGHEHNEGTTLIDSRSGNTGHVFNEFIVGGGGAGLYGCQRGDFCQSANGFATADVNGGTITVKIYKLGSPTPIKTVTWNN